MTLIMTHTWRLKFREMKEFAHGSVPWLKSAAHVGSSVSGSVYSCGLSLPASKSRATDVYTRAWISFHALALGLPVNQLIDHLWAAPAYLALCWELQGVGQERREIGVGPGVSPPSLVLR